MKDEKKCIYDKVMTCPLCGEDFETKVVRSGSLRRLEMDIDLRPRYENIDTLKYDVVLCRNCGYAALTQNFKPLPKSQRLLIEDQVSLKFIPKYNLLPETFTYEDAIERYKYAMASVIAKKGKSSERAMVCLKMAWTFRGQREELRELHPEMKQERKRIQAQEIVCLKKALHCFVKAYSEEIFPMADMDEPTVEYLIAALAYEVGELDLSYKQIYNILSKTGIPERIKNKARDLKEKVLALKQKLEMKQQKEEQ